MAFGELADAKVLREPAYPGGAPDLSSRLLARFERVHQ